MNHPVIHAVVFDFDGLILDTEGPVFAAWQAVFDAYGCGPLTVDEWAAEIGTVGGLDLVRIMRARAATPFDVETMHESRRRHRDELLALERVRPGVLEWLDAAATLGLGVAIASSSPDEWVRAHLERLGILERFAHVVCYGEGRAAKPAPDTYLAACGALGVAPRHALAVEDSPNGVRAARAAGVRAVVAVPNAVTAQLDLSEADIVLRSLSETTLPALLDHFAGPGMARRV